MAAPTKHVVVVGAGIMGASTAYYLSRLYPLWRVTILDKVEPACHSSGKAGGFLAVDWHQDPATASLAEASFGLHDELATALGADEIGYRRVNTISGDHVAAGAEAAPAAGPFPWLDRLDRKTVRALGGTGTCAQVTPRRLVDALMAAAISEGRVELRTQTEAVSVKRSADGKVSGVVVVGGGPDKEEAVLDCDAMVIAMGPWSSRAAEQAWFPAAADGLPTETASSKYTSLVLEAASDATAVFTSSDLHVELYPRPDGTVYVCGCPDDSTALPDDPLEIAPRATSVKAIATVAAAYSSELEEAAASAGALESGEGGQACYLPGGSMDGRPIIGPIPSSKGTAFACFGHGCWGILNGPASGRATADLVATGKTDVVPDISAFHPGRRR